MRCGECNRGPEEAAEEIQASNLLTVLPADKGSAAVVLGTIYDNQKIVTFLQDKAYAKLKRILRNP
jgi:hypothetical protein